MFHSRSKTCKGISKHTVKKDITIDDYRDTLFISFYKKKKKKKAHSMKSIKSHNHNIKCYDLSKCSVPCFDNKRYILKDGIITLACRHYKTKSKAKSDKEDRVTKEEP